MKQGHARARTLTELLLCLGGPIVWALHLFGLYGGATLACLPSTSDHIAFASFAENLTFISVAAVLGLIVWQAKRRWSQGADHLHAFSFLRLVSLVLASTALVAIFWSSVPLLLLPRCG
jgi:ABC-type xylose transport system permease subunit